MSRKMSKIAELNLRLTFTINIYLDKWQSLFCLVLVKAFSYIPDDKPFSSTYNIPYQLACIVDKK